MNVTVNSQILATELRALNKIIPAKPAINILGHVMLKAMGDSLSFYATDLEIGLSTDCHAQVTKSGVIALPAAKLLALVEQFTDADVTIALEGIKAIVMCGAFKSRLQAMPADDFPPATDPEGDANTLDVAAFQQLIDKTRYALSTSASKYILRGALLALSGPAAAMVTTDGKRLAIATMTRIGTDQNMVIPVKALDALIGQMNSDSIEVTVGGRHLFFAFGRRLLISRTIDGTFPQYERIIPRENDKVVTIDRSALSAALRRIVLIAEENYAVYFSLSPDALELSTSSAEVGSALETMRVSYEGPPLKVCINGNYVLDFLKAASSPTITMTLKDVVGAALLTDGDDHIAVIMQLNAGGK